MQLQPISFLKNKLAVAIDELNPLDFASRLTWAYLSLFVFSAQKAQQTTHLNHSRLLQERNWATIENSTISQTGEKEINTGTSH